MRICLLGLIILASASALNSLSLADSPVNRSKPMMTIRSEFQLVDGPAWNGNGTLFVPDPKAKQLWAYRPNTKTEWQLITEGESAFSGTFFQLGKLYVADNTHARILHSADGKALTEWAKFNDEAKPNDLVVARDGNAYVTMSKPGQIRRIQPDGTVLVAAENLESPNGITLSPDGRTLYVSLYKSGLIQQATVRDDGSLGAMQPFAKIEPSANGAMADGMAIDRAGNVYCAGAEAVWIWDAEGKLLDKIVTPQRPINCTFGDSHGTELYISTFGGLVKQSMHSYGIDPNIPWDGSANKADLGDRLKLPESVQAHWDVVYEQVGPRKLLADIFVPKPLNQNRPAIVLVHGGGWLHGDKTRFRPLAFQLASAGYVVAAIEYRLGYEAKFPAGIQDCNAAVHFLRSHAANYGIDPTRIGAVGGSAGGQLVGLMATAPEVDGLQPASKKSDSSKIKAAVIMAGAMQVASGSIADRSHAGMTSNAIDWFGKSIDEAPEIYHLADSYEKITADDPPILFVTGSLDHPERDVPPLEKLKAVGVYGQQVIHQGAKHGHWNQAPWVDQVAKDIIAFLDKHL